MWVFGWMCFMVFNIPGPHEDRMAVSIVTVVLPRSDGFPASFFPCSVIDHGIVMVSGGSFVSPGLGTAHHDSVIIV